MHYFTKAKPIWVQGKSCEKNVTCGFHGELDSGIRKGEPVLLKLTGSSAYKVYVNDELLQYGPARSAKGYFRVDCIDLVPYLTAGNNHIAIEVTGCNINAFSVMNQPSFLQAEVSSSGQVFLATGSKNDFICVRLQERIQKVQRYSFQRTFVEAYELSPGYADWKLGSFAGRPVECSAILDERLLLPRRIPISVFDRAEAKELIGTADVSIREAAETRKLLFVDHIGETILGFPKEQLEVDMVKELDCLVFNEVRQTEMPVDDVVLREKESAVYKMEKVKSGFLCAAIKCRRTSLIYLIFDEIPAEKGGVNPFRSNSINAIRLTLQPGDYQFESARPYGAGIIQAVCLEGELSIRNISMHLYECPMEITAKYQNDSMDLKLIYEAAKETFRQNATDIFMDCPTRERAGWLCDSFFMARAERALTGHNEIEMNFLENYMLPLHFDCIPDGMLPMCYPSDHYDGNFIPNWAMWFIVEMADFQKRGNDRGLLERMKEKILNILAFLSQYENEFGLLENLPGWVFIEWSRSNDLTGEVNIPSNMQYAECCSIVGNLYNIPKFIQKAERLRKTIFEMAYQGLFFADQLIRVNGKLQPGAESTETCQYYAFFFHTMEKEKVPRLYETLLEQFGPHRRKSGAYPEIADSAMFIGAMLRLTILSEAGFKKQCNQEIREYFHAMAECTGTLWEHGDTQASCNHGFASYAAYLLLMNDKKCDG